MKLWIIPFSNRYKYISSFEEGVSKGLPKKKSQTIVKRRFLDHISKNKVLGVYSVNDDKLFLHLQKHPFRCYINK